MKKGIWEAIREAFTRRMSMRRMLRGVSASSDRSVGGSILHSGWGPGSEFSTRCLISTGSCI